MRKIYLIRHALPDFPGNEKYCMGSADFPLGTLGRMQCCLLKHVFDRIKFSAVFTSPLSRAVETASAISHAPIKVDGLTEMSAGDWDGLTFSEIRRRWPELYELRGLDRNIPIPGSEDIWAGQERFYAAVQHCILRSKGDIAIVAHSTVIQSLIAKVMGTDINKCRQYTLPHCSYTEFNYDGELLELCRYGVIDKPAMDKELCISLLTAADVSDDIVSHCRAVAKESRTICDELGKAGIKLDAELIEYAALLHDIARLEPKHAALGSEWLYKLGYNDIAALIEKHHDYDKSIIDEAAVLYIADKLVSDNGRVSIEDRFTASAKKCCSDEAIMAHQRRYEAALRLKEKINSLCGKELVL